MALISEIKLDTTEAWKALDALDAKIDALQAKIDLLVLTIPNKES